MSPVQDSIARHYYQARQPVVLTTTSGLPCRATALWLPSDTTTGSPQVALSPLPGSLEKKATTETPIKRHDGLLSKRSTGAHRSISTPSSYCPPIELFWNEQDDVTADRSTGLPSALVENALSIGQYVAACSPSSSVRRHCMLPVQLATTSDARQSQLHLQSTRKSQLPESDAWALCVQCFGCLFRIYQPDMACNLSRCLGQGARAGDHYVLARLIMVMVIEYRYYVSAPLGRLQLYLLGSLGGCP